LSAAQSEARIEITFTVNSATPCLLGRTLSAPDWIGVCPAIRNQLGDQRSPYMRTLSWNLGNLGNESLTFGRSRFCPGLSTCNITGTAGPVCRVRAPILILSASREHAMTSPLLLGHYNNTSGASFNGSNVGTSVSVNPGSSCGGYRLTSSFTCSNCGATPVECFVDVTVQDNTAPTVTFCPSNATINCPAVPSLGLQHLRIIAIKI
jgi:hypothetical protein